VSTIVTTPQDPDVIRWRRIVSPIFASIDAYIEQGAHPLAVMEEFPMGLAGGGGVSGKVADRLGLRGVLLYGFDARGVPVAMVNPTTLKVYATGGGRSDKAEMTTAARAQFGVRIANDNEADALWLLRMGLDHYRDGDTGSVDPKSQAACARVRWPNWSYQEVRS
jgi:Holliday junction resolvasome RuvABC endonuclease subunit